MSGLVLAGLGLFPGVLGGYVLGRLAQRWSDARFRPMLLMLCSASAAVALYRAFA